MKWLLVLLLSVSLRVSAAPVWSDVNVQTRDVAFVAGYLSASIYDLTENKKGYLLPDGTILAQSHAEKISDVRAVAWKMGLGLLAGTAIAICDASLNNSPIPFEDFVFGGLGGLTCVVIHF